MVYLLLFTVLIVYDTLMIKMNKMNKNCNEFELNIAMECLL